MVKYKIKYGIVDYFIIELNHVFFILDMHVRNRKSGISSLYLA